MLIQSTRLLKKEIRTRTIRGTHVAKNNDHDLQMEQDYGRVTSPCEHKGKQENAIAPLNAPVAVAKTPPEVKLNNIYHVRAMTLANPTACDFVTSDLRLPLLAYSTSIYSEIHPVKSHTIVVKSWIQIWVDTRKKD